MKASNTRSLSLSSVSYMLVLGVSSSFTQGCFIASEADKTLRRRMNWLEESQTELIRRNGEAFSLNQAEVLIGRPPDVRCSIGDLQSLLDKWSHQHEEPEWPELSEFFHHAIQLVTERDSLSEDEAIRQFPHCMISIYLWDVPTNLYARVGGIFPHTDVQQGLAMNYLLFSRGELIDVGMTNMPVEAFDEDPKRCQGPIDTPGSADP